MSAFLQVDATVTEVGEATDQRRAFVVVKLPKLSKILTIDIPGAQFEAWAEKIGCRIQMILMDVNDPE